jgi:hypothetical protein
MKKPKFLWHGSIKKFNFLNPSKAKDNSGENESNLFGVYATDIKELAIGFGLIDKKYDKFADYNKNPVQMVVINGEIRKGESFYLYKISSKDFTEKPKNSHQWFSFKKVKPLEILKLEVDDYNYLTRKATKKDIKYYKSIIGKFK